MEKKYKDYLKEYKENILEWVDRYGMSFEEAFDGIKDYLYLVPIDYRDDIRKELKIWSIENEKIM